ncbi:hypothetical protein LINPERHAP2_LOCUS9339, partial [Linum perenne]
APTRFYHLLITNKHSSLKSNDQTIHRFPHQIHPNPSTIPPSIPSLTNSHPQAHITIHSTTH